MSNTINLKGVAYKVLFPDLFRPHTAAEAAEFERSIKESGILSPATVDEANGIIDGANRMRKAEELDIDCPVVVLKELSRGEKRMIAEQLNTARRQISVGEMKSRRAERLEKAVSMRSSGRSYRQIGDALGISHTQAQADVEEVLEKSEGRAQPEKIKGKDGVERSAKSPEKHPDPPLLPVDPGANDGAASAAIVDKKGTPIPDTLRDIMADNWHTSSAAVLDQIAKQAKTVAKWSKHLEGDAIRLLKQAADIIRSAAPDHVCVDCKGEGCAECNTSGYIAGGKKK